ncbi:hypothetical protein ACFUV2_09045 [Streptomyces pilosus]|uniref:hypothetical protein n=1 Tax=Streptomyces pilosus TaxID=28893 RepID=UPI0019AD550F|nr:hypothetical protein [Streptomyces pilosus]GGV71394.1 hypothetical protein GCM10010261_67320 [Streptomyces pilosus]
MNDTPSTTATLHGWNNLLADPPADLAPAARAYLPQLAALTGHWHRNARKPTPPGAPGLRAYQHRAAAAGLALLGCCLS